MKMHPGIQRKRHRKSFLAASSLLLLFATQTVAQSGRRAPKPAEPPVSTPKTDSETSKDSARELKQRVSLLVGSRTFVQAPAQRRRHFCKLPQTPRRVQERQLYLDRRHQTRSGCEASEERDGFGCCPAAV